MAVRIARAAAAAPCPHGIGLYVIDLSFTRLGIIGTGPPWYGRTGWNHIRESFRAAAVFPAAPICATFLTLYRRRWLGRGTSWRWVFAGPVAHYGRAVRRTPPRPIRPPVGRSVQGYPRRAAPAEAVVGWLVRLEPWPWACRSAATSLVRSTGGGRVLAGLCAARLRFPSCAQYSYSISYFVQYFHTTVVGVPS